MKTIFDNVTRMIPVVRVNNRELNLTFYKEVLGFKVITEENALVILGGKNAKTVDDAVLILEESPSMRTRAVNGVKKLKKIVLKSSTVTEAFQATSPEGDVFEIIPSDDALVDLKVCDIQLSSGNIEDCLAFYTAGFELAKKSNQIVLPFGTLTYSEATGEDLIVEPETTWDIEVIEFKVSQDVDLKQIAQQLDELSLSYYVDAKGKVLTLSDAQNIEVWFTK